MSKALLVIDMQNICVGENHAEFFKYDHDQLIGEVNKAIEANKDNHVIYVLNIMKNNLLSKIAPFKAYEGTPEVELVNGLDIVSDLMYKKYNGDSFSNQDLKNKLKELGIDAIEIVGVDGGGCVGITALTAIKEGYSVVMNTSAIGTVMEKRAVKLNKKLKMLGARFI